MAANGDVKIEKKLNGLSIDCDERENILDVQETVHIEKEEFSEKWGFRLKDLYRLALKFYKEKEGKAIFLSYEDRLKLVALTRQVSHGKCNPDSFPPHGVLDVIGRDRRLAWEALGDMPRLEAKAKFVELLDRVCPLFRPYIEAHKRDEEERKRIAQEEYQRKQEEEERKRLEEEERKREEELQAKKEMQRRQIQDALNQQTYLQFKLYAEQQYPGNPEQQGVLIRQLQEQHYHQYMQQLYQQQQCNQQNNNDKDMDLEKETSLLSNGMPYNEVAGDTEDESQEQIPAVSAASMWTRKDIKDFKESIRKDSGDGIIRIEHGETVTVRVPTLEGGTCLFWEFATDNYDIGFGVFFEWTDTAETEVSVHITESEDDDDEEDDDEEEAPTDDVEGTPILQGSKESKPSPPLSVIVPVYRRDCQEEVYAGSHVYPGQGVYLLKFDNSYSLWRSKTLYYRVYYTR